MQVSYNWLSEYVDLTKHTVGEVSKLLTDIGLEVEAQESTAPFPATVVVGKILEAVKHPNADSLRLCKVDVGNPAGPLGIVCGAPNAREGILVACALVGTDFGGGFKIKASKIRGESSEGMLCSGKELGISEDTDGIMELPESYALGKSVAALMGIADHILTLNVTPNRAECLSHIGVARDLAAKLKTTIKLPKSAPVSTKQGSKESIKIHLADDGACARFVAVVIQNVGTGPSPKWMQRRLEGCGMRPVNTIVDVTNYVMLEYGQPIHAYDERDVRGKEFKVRRAVEDETLTTLDGQKRALLAGDILICDGIGPIGLAGIMGGQNSEIKTDTTAIVVEVACFDSVQIRQTAKRLGIHSEASHRFERGVDQGALEQVALRVVELLQKCHAEAPGGDKKTGPTALLPVLDIVTSPIPDRKIALRISRCRSLLGMTLLSSEEMLSRLKGLGFSLVDKAEDRLLFDIPSWRGDILREVDLIEEVGRMVGYDKVLYDLPKMSIRPIPEDPFIDFADSARGGMASLGCTEVICFPFLKADDLTKLRITTQHPLGATVELKNPLTEDERWMRTSLVPGLLQAVLRNRNSHRTGVRLFECGRGYYWFKEKEQTSGGPLYQDFARHGRHLAEKAKTESRTTERHLMGFVLDQPFTEKGWNSAAISTTFYHGKMVVTEFLRQYGIASFQLVPLAPDEIPFVHPGVGARIVLGQQSVGYVGELHPMTADAYGLDVNAPPVVGEVDLEKVFGFLKTLKVTVAGHSAFPPARRDLAFVVKEAVTHEQVVRTMKKCAKKKFLTDIALFDIYKGTTIPQGQKSMAYSLTFSSTERTLTDAEVDGEVTAVMGWLKEQVGAEQRL